MSSDLEICFPLQLHKRKISSLIFKQELCSWLYFSKFMSCRNTRLGFDHVMTTKFAIFNLGILTPSLSSFEWKGESECHSRSKGDFPSLHLKKKKNASHLCLTLEIFSFEILQGIDTLHIMLQGGIFLSQYIARWYCFNT